MILLSHQKSEALNCNLKYLSVLYNMNNWFIVIIVVIDVRSRDEVARGPASNLRTFLKVYNKRRGIESSLTRARLSGSELSCALTLSAPISTCIFSTPFSVYMFLIVLLKKLCSNVKTSSWPIITVYHFILSLDLHFWFGSDIVGINLLLVTTST